MFDVSAIALLLATFSKGCRSSMEALFLIDIFSRWLSVASGVGKIK